MPSHEGALPYPDLARDVCIGEWKVRPAEGLLVRHGEENRLRPRAMEVLALLATRPGHVVSKEEIFVQVWEGNAVEDGALAHCISEIRGALGDTPRSPRYIETIPKRGYRLVAPVAAGDAAALDPAPPAPSHRSWSTRGLAVAALLAGLAVAGFLIWWSTAGADPEETGSSPPAAADKRPSRVAVLGFSNLSGEPQAHWLSTALSEMLTTELAVSEVVKPIPADTVAKIKRDLSIADSDRLEAETLRRLRAGLGVDYVVVGSYLAAAGGESDEIRIDLRLQDHRSGEIVAAVVETGTVTELADLMLLAGLRLRRALGEEAHLANDRALSADHLPASPTAARHYFQGLLHLRRFEAAAATELLERSAAEEPEAPQTHFALAEAWSLLGYDLRAAAAADRALGLSSGLPRENRLWIEARCHGLAARWDEAIERFSALRLLAPANLDYGLELARAQLASGKLGEAQATLSTLEEQQRAESRDPRLELLAAEAAAQSGDYTRSVAAALSARELAQELSAPLAAGRALLLEGEGLYALGRVPEAQAALEEAKRIFAQVGDRKSEASAGITLAGWLWNRGEYEQTEAVARQALTTFREIGNRAGESEALRRLGMAVWRRGDAGEGERMVLRALDTFREIGNRSGEADTLSSLAIAAAAFGGSRTYGAALPPCTLFEQALAIYRELNDRAGVGRTVANLGRCAMIAGNVTQATTALEEAAAIDRELNTPNGLATTLFNLAYAESLAGDLTAAESHFREVARLFRRLENPRMLAASLAGLGAVHTMTGDFQAAEEEFQESLRLRRELDDPVRISDCLSALARLRAHQGDAEQAERLAREAVSLGETAPHFYGDEARQELAFVLHEIGRHQAARVILEKLDLLDPAVRVNVRLLASRITLGRALGATGDRERGRAVLADVIAVTESNGMDRLRLEAELADFEITGRAGLDPTSRRRLQALAEDARQRGLALLARKAERLLAAGSRRASSPPASS